MVFNTAISRRRRRTVATSELPSVATPRTATSEAMTSGSRSTLSRLTTSCDGNWRSTTGPNCSRSVRIAAPVGAPGARRTAYRGHRCARVDVHDHLDATRVARIDLHAHHAADVDAEVAHRTALRETAHRAVEIDLVAHEVAVLVAVGVPVDDGGEQDDGPGEEKREPVIADPPAEHRTPGGGDAQQQPGLEQVAPDGDALAQGR